MPLPDGLGWSIKSEPVISPSGVATSPIKLSPSLVLMVIAVRFAGNTVEGRINSGTKRVYSYSMSISFEVSTDKTFEKFDPKSSNVIATYKDYSPEEVFQIVANAKTASRAWKNLGTKGRKKVLTNWAKYLTQNVEELSKLLAQETGKPLSDAMLEVSLAISHLTWANKHAPEILSAQRRSPGLLMFNMKSYVQREPFGCIGVIGPWNYPVFTPMGSIVYALAAGNTVVFKPSEFTPGCGKWLADTFANLLV